MSDKSIDNKQKSSGQNSMMFGGRGPGSRGKIESAKDFKKTIKRFIMYFGTEKKVLIVAGIAIIAATLLRVITPAMVGNAIKENIEINPDAAMFIERMFQLLGIYVAVWLIEGISGILMTKSANNIVFKMRNQAFAHVQKLSMSYFDKKGIGDVMSRLTNDIESIYNILSNGFSALIGGVLSLVGTVIAMIVLDFKLSLVVILVVPILLYMTTFIGKRVRKVFRKNQALIGGMSSKIQESFSGMKVIKTFGREEEEYAEFEKINSKVRDMGIKADLTAYLLNPLMNFFMAFTLALVVAGGGFLIMKYEGIYSVGLLTSFIMYARRFAQPLRRLTGVYNMLQSSIAGAERVFEVLDTKVEVNSCQDAVILDDIYGDIEFKNVIFGYDKDKIIIDDISFKAQRGEVVAIVGPTGVGKTTLINLLSRFYDVDEGVIAIDKQDIRKIDLNSLRSKMGVVLQESFFFSTTIRENLLYGNPSASDEEIIQAARLARADHFIKKLPKGYDTVLSERGMNLSQGERQLLAIARAILADPKILILDEATSNIDTLTEVHIQEGLLELMKNRTSFIIAHRLSTIKNADKVLVMKNGKIIEQGKHQELLKLNGFYSTLYKMQG